MGTVNPTFKEAVEGWGVIAPDFMTSSPETLEAKLGSAENDMFRSFMIGDNHKIEAAQHAIEGSVEKAELLDKQEKEKDIADIAREQGVETLQKMREKMQEQMNNVGGIEMTDEEVKKYANRLVQRIEKDADRFAKENGLSAAETALVLEAAKDVAEQIEAGGSYDEDALRAKYGDEVIDNVERSLATEQQNDHNEFVSSIDSNHIDASESIADLDKQEAPATELAVETPKPVDQGFSFG